MTSHFPLPEMVLLLRAASAVPLFNELPLAHSELEFALGRTRGTSAFSSFSPVLARGLLKLGDPAINAFSCFCFFLRTMGCMADKKQVLERFIFPASPPKQFPQAKKSVVSTSQ